MIDNIITYSINPLIIHLSLCNSHYNMQFPLYTRVIPTVNWHTRVYNNFIQFTKVKNDWKSIVTGVDLRDLAETKKEVSRKTYYRA